MSAGGTFRSTENRPRPPSDLLSRPQGDLIAVIAHSSGAYVANELFRMLYDWGGDEDGSTRGKVVYLNLDGDGGIGDATVQSLGGLYWVWAEKGSMESMNAGTMQYYAGLYGSGFAVDAEASGCLNAYCLHDAVINDHPWDPEGFDVERDYGLFAEGEHEVQMQYLQVLRSEAAESADV
ncbi:unnamed protein product [Darwinula stevensoni]|uniref:Uncharacterized protein n=1 Tax=Darwinula stevensoni TaxID=69355 RepID=A0A7R8X909_9CRUS|nr:unnamed protein product [Darwinula stevensoni]CAG0890629.1 unnamed protein product [Darwinula stevensoni]